MDIRAKLGVVLLVAAILLGLVSSRSAGAASVVVDAASGAVLSAEAPNHLWYPASLTKLMTVYVALAEIGAGRLSLADKLTVSARGASVPPVRFGWKQVRRSRCARRSMSRSSLPAMMQRSRSRRRSADRKKNSRM